jgi:hypothetical protein
MQKEFYLHELMDIHQTLYKIEELKNEAIEYIEILELTESLTIINSIADLYNHIKKYQPYLNELFPHYKKAFKNLDQMTWTLKTFKVEKTI